jgi:hypothetical protein
MVHIMPKQVEVLFGGRMFSVPFMITELCLLVLLEMVRQSYFGKTPGM